MWSRNEAKRAVIIVVNVQRLFRANRGGSNEKVDLSSPKSDCLDTGGTAALSDVLTKYLICHVRREQCWRQAWQIMYQSSCACCCLHLGLCPGRQT